MTSIWLVFYQDRAYGHDAVDEEDAVRQHNEQYRPSQGYPDAQNLYRRKATASDWNDMRLDLEIAEEG